VHRLEAKGFASGSLEVIEKGAILFSISIFSTNKSCLSMKKNQHCILALNSEHILHAEEDCPAHKV
jgi:hypothetical protein